VIITAIQRDARCRWIHSACGSRELPRTAGTGGRREPFAAAGLAFAGRFLGLDVGKNRAAVQSLDDLARQTDKGVLATTLIQKSAASQSAQSISIERICAEVITPGNRQMFTSLTGT